VLFFNSQHIHSNAIPTIESDIIVASGRDLRHGFISLTINYLFPLIFSIGMSCSYYGSNMNVGELPSCWHENLLFLGIVHILFGYVG
jgi:hypothetical protein